MTDDSPASDRAGEPDLARVRHFLLYSLSLPERALRSATGLVGGGLRESCDLLVPQAFRSGRTYSILVQQMLDFLAEDVGGVQRKAAAENGPKIENYVARKAVANFIDLAGLATLHLSPMLLLAVVSDVAYGSQTYLRELADELKRQGVIAADSTVDHVDDLLAAVANAAGTTALAFAVPPLSVEGLKKTIEDTRASVRSIDPAGVLPQAETRRLWEEIHEVATSQGVSPLAISSAMTLYSLRKVGTACRGALSSVTVAGRLLDRLVLAHYERAWPTSATKASTARWPRPASPTSRPSGGTSPASGPRSPRISSPASFSAAYGKPCGVVGRVGTSSISLPACPAAAGGGH